MLNWWQALSEDNQTKLLIGLVPVILVLLGAIGFLIKKLLFDKKESITAEPITISGDTNTQTTQGGTSAINTGSGHIQSGHIYHVGITLEQYKQDLKEREAEVKADLDQAHAKDRKLLDTKLDLIQHELQDVKISYEAHITSLKQRITQLEILRGQLPDEVLDQAKTVLAQGDRQHSDQLFKQIEDQAESVIKVTAEAAYQRSQIAKDAMLYIEAITHIQKAVRLLPDKVLYLNAAAELLNITGINQIAKDMSEKIRVYLNSYGEDDPDVAMQSLGEHKKAIEYYELALATFENKLRHDHPSTKTVQASLADVKAKRAHSDTE